MSEEMANSHMLVLVDIFKSFSFSPGTYYHQIYSPVTESSFKSRRLPNSQVNVSCTFSGVFPLPNVKLTWGKFDLFADKMTAEVNPYSECYEVTIHKVLEHQELPSQTKFGCEIEIPGTDYFVRYYSLVQSITQYHGVYSSNNSLYFRGLILIKGGGIKSF